MSGDTCSPMMHGEPCYSEIADTIESLQTQLAEARAQLAAIEEDGTREHNAAINLRKELAKARMAANSTPLLQKIRTALGMNEKFPFSHLDAKAAEIVRRAQTAEAALAAEQETVMRFAGDLLAAGIAIELLRRPFRNADDLDWEFLFKNLLDDSGHGRFWKAVMTEMRESLTSPNRNSEVEK